MMTFAMVIFCKVFTSIAITRWTVRRAKKLNINYKLKGDVGALESHLYHLPQDGSIVTLSGQVYRLTIEYDNGKYSFHLSIANISTDNPNNRK